MRTVFTLSLALLMLSSGCAKFDMSKNIPWGAGKDGEFSGNLRIVAVWQDTVLHQPDKPPVRGFGGRVFLYAGGEKPVKSNGRLEVYAFVEDGRKKTDTRPDRKYVFTPEQFEKHYSPKKPLGHSYSFWLPWDEAGGPELEVSLVARFTPITGGATIVSELTHHSLPGREATLAEKLKYRYKPHEDSLEMLAKKDGEDGEQGHEGQLVSYDEPLKNYPGQQLDLAQANRPRMKTSTIDLPQRFNAGNTGNTPTWRTSVVPGVQPAAGVYGGYASQADYQAAVPPGYLTAPPATGTQAYYVAPGGAVAPGTVTPAGGAPAGLSPLPAAGGRIQSYPQFRARPNPQYPGQAQPAYRSGVGAEALPPTAGAPMPAAVPGVNSGAQYAPGVMPLDPAVNAAQAQQPPVGYRPAQSRALGAPIAPLERAHGAWLPDHVKWQYGLEPQPQRNFVTGPASRAAAGS